MMGIALSMGKSLIYSASKETIEFVNNYKKIYMEVLENEEANFRKKS
ncbi:hypothetical protein [Clostridium felsineum]|nr:hypothetical protein [Clostridium felsineum]URZ16655.1 hypothetical protein CLFE_027020 [Clostridium felsineum DSM 794]